MIDGIMVIDGIIDYPYQAHRPVTVVKLYTAIMPEETLVQNRV